MFCVQVPIWQTRPLDSDFEGYVRQYGSYVEPRENVMWSQISGHSSPYLADTKYPDIQVPISRTRPLHSDF